MKIIVVLMLLCSSLFSMEKIGEEGNVTYHCISGFVYAYTSLVPMSEKRYIPVVDHDGDGKRVERLACENFAKWMEKTKN